MIFNCYYCGWAINSRRNCADVSQIGKTKLYDNKRFHDECIEVYKEYPQKKYYNHGESQDWNGYWKIERKLGRVRKT